MHLIYDIDAIFSFCRRYDFRRIGNNVIADQVSKLLKAEGVEADEDAVRYVAKAADGSMRDALSLLEQCISFYYGQRLTYEKVLDVLGAVDTQVFSKLLRLIIRCDVPGCVQLMDEISSQGRDLSQFVTDFIWYLRTLVCCLHQHKISQIPDKIRDKLAKIAPLGTDFIHQLHASRHITSYNQAKQLRKYLSRFCRDVSDMISGELEIM